MSVLGSGGFPWWDWGHFPKPRQSRGRRSPKSSDGAGAGGGGGNGPPPGFPLKPAATAASLALAGDTIAQVRERLKGKPHKDVVRDLLEGHDWVRALRMCSYGFLLYGPGSYAWYQFLDRAMPEATLANISVKVLLNQIVLGPCVIAVVFAWNNLWQKKLAELPAKYQKDALPTLLYGFRFWIPASILNFRVIPLQARVAFMSTCAIFWNYYLSSTMSR